jgi:hypothetical protein
MTPLTDADLQLLDKLTISRQIVERARLYRVDRLQAKEVLGIELDCEGGVVFPYFFPPYLGNQTTQPVYHRIRQDEPPVNAVTRKVGRKYLAPPGRTYPYFAPVDPALHADRRASVVIVESQKSALAILRWAEDHRRKIIPVAINGCFGWRGKVGIGTTADGRREEMKDLLDGIQVACAAHDRNYICLDANASINPDVLRAQEWLVETLIEKGVTDVRTLALPLATSPPGWNGPDDFIAENGDDALFDVFESADRRNGERAGRATFHRICELAEGEPEAIIEGYFEEGVSFLGAKSGVGKTWIGISEGQALRSGKPFLGTFRVPKQREVMYLVPEVTERRFRSRCEKLGVDIEDPGFVVQTMSDGAPLPLDHPDLRRYVEKFKPIIFLDTAIRFVVGVKENEAGDVSKGVGQAAFQLVKLGAPAVRALHHRAKDASDDDLTLENTLRGSGDFGASASTVWCAAHVTAVRDGKVQEFDRAGKKNGKQNAERERVTREYLKQSRKMGRVHLELVKPGDREAPMPEFRIQLRPGIDEDGEIEMMSKLPVDRVEPRAVVDALFMANPRASLEELTDGLGLGPNCRPTARRRANEYGWFYDKSSKLWVKQPCSST